jgi:hypothetical protein
MLYNVANTIYSFRGGQMTAITERALTIACGEMKGCVPEICMNLHVRNDSTIAEANRFTATVLFALFQTFLTAKQLLEWLSEQQTSARQNAEVAHLDVALSSNGGPT